MKLSRAASYFDRSIFTDAYGTTSLKAQLEPLDYYKIDGAAVKRRIMSVAPSVVLPARNTLRIDGQVFITGDTAVDYWEGKALRKRYVLQGADDLATLRSIAEVLADAAGTQAYTAKVWNKWETDSRVNSDYTDEYHLYFAPGEPLALQQLVLCDGTWYFIRDVHTAQSGLLDGIAHRLEGNPKSTATFDSRVYNPVPGTYTSTPVTVPAVTLRWQENFQYLSQGSADYVRGDAQVWVLASDVAAPKAGDKVTINSIAYKVLSTFAEGTCYSLHVRPA